MAAGLQGSRIGAALAAVDPGAAVVPVRTSEDVPLVLTHAAGRPVVVVIRHPHRVEPRAILEAVLAKRPDAVVVSTGPRGGTMPGCAWSRPSVGVGSWRRWRRGSSVEVRHDDLGRSRPGQDQRPGEWSRTAYPGRSSRLPGRPGSRISQEAKPCGWRCSGWCRTRWQLPEDLPQTRGRRGGGGRGRAHRAAAESLGCALVGDLGTSVGVTSDSVTAHAGALGGGPGAVLAMVQARWPWRSGPTAPSASSTAGDTGSATTVAGRGSAGRRFGQRSSRPKAGARSLRCGGPPRIASAR